VRDAVIALVLAIFNQPIPAVGPTSKEYAVHSVVEAIKNNPVRLYSIAVASLALIAFYVPTLPVVLILGLVAAVLGVGETVRAHVTPTRNLPPTNAVDVPEGDVRFG
jgi:hypothetical protein